MVEVVSKKDVIEKLEEDSLLQGRKLVAVLLTGSRLYNLATEESDYDYTVIYVPSKEEIYYNHKEVTQFKVSIGEHVVEGKLLSFRKFLMDLGKPSLNSFEVLYDKEFFVPECKKHFANKHFLNIFIQLQNNVEELFRENTGGIFNTLRGHMFSRLKRLLRATEPSKLSKEYMHFLRLENLIYALHNGSEMKPYVITEGYLLEYRLPENVKTKEEYVSLMEESLEKVKDKDFEQEFNLPHPEVPLEKYHQMLMNLLYA